ncbi:DUF4159 domain-containing protein [Saccharibacter sp. 17.LH.SD]|uniref:DUF4159 domain-containing protein n=1 Tax=Saccharibacter sp. 17.LH.SD TaxID=2689393 RepID=UPI001370ABAF|nr:DUF4159 domain-containing protein [Saccharibacter sp. 17.LH.SD]MXV44800.1 DUF4159 domain-containing protein [Saccharibacter sp. 17.LH.SD]
MIFLAPFLLLGLITLPALWWLVRATPPKPRKQEFSSLLLLRRLQPKRHDAAHAPLWLLLLRLTAVALIVFAFAQPVFVSHRDQNTPQSLVIILDDGWAAFPHWHERQQTALTLGAQTLRAGGHVTLFLSAREADGRFPPPFTPSDTLSLERYVHELHPHPWPVDRQSLATQLTQSEYQQTIPQATVVILSDSLAQDHDLTLKTSLSTAHHIEEIRWPRCDLILLRHDTTSRAHLTVLAETLPHCPSRSLPLNGLTLDEHGQFNTIAHWTLLSNHAQNLNLPEVLVDSLDALSIPGAPVPAGMDLLKSGHHQHVVGLLHLNGDTAPLVGSDFYLTQALNTISTVHNDGLTSLLSHPLSLLIAPDGTLSSEADLSQTLKWVRQGGVLVRFAGTEMANHDDSALSPTAKALLPVPLLHGTRQLGGAMSWGSPQSLAPFPVASPFSGITIPKDVTISRQVLAQPTSDLSEHTWATLADGTPLVTARHEGHGLVILFHITPTADWSNLPLSGLFPQMLNQLIINAPTLAQDVIHSPSTTTTWPAWKILSPEGTLVAPASFVQPLSTHTLLRVDEHHPAGFYGDESHARPLNLADALPPLQDELKLGLEVSPDRITPEQALWPYLGLFGLFMLALDMVLSLKRQGALSLTLFRTLSILFVIHCLPNAYADTTHTDVPQSALDIRLAYIETGDPDLDSAVQEGLEGLTRFVNQRSTAHLGSPLGVIPGRDDLAFYPLIYWPITAHSKTNPAQDAALNDYMKHGGMLLIDEMGAGSSLDNSDGQATRMALKRVTAGLSIPPLAILGDQHTLSHTFYLLRDYPGRIAGQTVYVARSDNDDSTEDVSPVIIGNADWAHAWAKDSNGNAPFAVIPDGESQRALAYRFGFNAVIYALTGNYKNDQRHYPEMLHRLKGTQDDSPSSESEDSP